MPLDLTERGDNGEEWWALIPPDNTKYNWQKKTIYLNFMTLEEFINKLTMLRGFYDPDYWKFKLAHEIPPEGSVEVVVDGNDYGNSRQKGIEP